MSSVSTAFKVHYNQKLGNYDYELRFYHRGYAVALCLFVCQTQAVVVPEWSSLGSRKQCSTIAQEL